MRKLTRTNMGRPADRTAKVVSDIRRDIVTGALAPGSRLPSRVDIVRRYGASGATVQRALNQLASEGFVRVDRTLATYIESCPPHLNRYVLVVPEAQSASKPVNMWYAALSRAVGTVSKLRGITIDTAFDINQHGDSPSYIRLIDEIQTNRVAGLIFAFPPWLFHGSLLLEQPGLPRVVANACDGPSSVRGDEEPVVKAMRALRESGRRRVAVFAQSRRDVSGFAGIVADCGLETRPYWIQRADLATPDTVCEVVQLMMCPENSVHPDAIYVDDDNLIDPVIAGLMATGKKVPSDVELIAHESLPAQANSSVPVRRFGVDARLVISRCVDSLQRQQSGDLNPIQYHVPLVFEEDLMSDSAASEPLTSLTLER